MTDCRISSEADVREAQKRKKSTFFFGCPKHGETRFCTVSKKCIACSTDIKSRGDV